MNLSKQNLALLVAAAVLAVPTVLQLRKETEIFKDIATIPLLFDGFTSDNVGQVLMGARLGIVGPDASAFLTDVERSAVRGEPRAVG